MYERNAIPDDPVVRCMERTGYPPWVRPYYPGCPDSYEDEDEQYEDMAYWHDAEEYWGDEPMAVYDPE